MKFMYDLTRIENPNERQFGRKPTRYDLAWSEDPPFLRELCSVLQMLFIYNYLGTTTKLVFVLFISVYNLDQYLSTNSLIFITSETVIYNNFNVSIYINIKYHTNITITKAYQRITA